MFCTHSSTKIVVQSEPGGSSSYAASCCISTRLLPQNILLNLHLESATKHNKSRFTDHQGNTAMSHGRESRRLALPWPAARSSNAGYSPVSPKPSNLSPGNAVNTPVVGASRALRSTSFIVITALVMTIGSFARESWHLPLRSSEPAVIGTVQRPDYYAQPGTIVVKKDSVRKYESARFLSMDNAVDVQSRKQTGLESTLQLGDGWDDLQALQRAVKFDHLTNKTVVLLGDSVDRFFVDHLCQDFLPSSELTYNALHVAPADLSPITSPDSYYDEFSEPHLCTLPEHLGGLKIWSVMFYGVLTKDDEEWSFKVRSSQVMKSMNGGLAYMSTGSDEVTQTRRGQVAAVQPTVG